ncbi:alginate O-acetyltransferase complex protein AlgI [Desulfovibrionales bacterium]
MLFNSPLFLFWFLPTVLTLYVLTPIHGRNGLLLLASLFFYVWGEPYNYWVLIMAIIGNLIIGRKLEACRAARPNNGKKWLTFGILLNCCGLFYYKYSYFVLENLIKVCEFLNKDFWADPNQNVHLPMGISFFTFQSIAYLIDVYRGICPAQVSLLQLGLFLSLFPKISQGPILRWSNLALEWKDRALQLTDWSDGLRRFIIGLGKKVLIANTLGVASNQIMVTPGVDLSPALAWIGAICYTLQIYYDFSGYTDMALGISLVFGFKLPENFNYPYAAHNIQNFWHRWHITLSSWFRDYVYIPLGGNRVSQLRTYVNLIVVFLLTGIWHGTKWNFIVWSLFHGLFLVLERLGLARILERLWQPVSHLYTMTVVTVSWVFFRIENLDQAWDYVRAMFALEANSTLKHQPSMYLHREEWLFLAIGALFAMPILPYLANQLHDNLSRPIFESLRGLAMFGILAISVLYTASSTYSPFIYFRF